MVENENYRGVYEAVDKMNQGYSFYPLPLYNGASDTHADFENNVKTVLRTAHIQYMKRVSDGEDPELVLTELAESSLAELRSLSEKQEGIQENMKSLNRVSIKAIVSQLRRESISMRRRFYFFIISAIAIVLSLILLLFNLFGIMNPTNRQIMEILDTQLLSYTDNIKDDYNKIAAHAISFSQQLETSIQRYLTENDLTFEDLKNNPEALANLQNHLYNLRDLIHEIKSENIAIESLEIIKPSAKSQPTSVYFVLRSKKLMGTVEIYDIMTRTEKVISVDFLS